MNLLQKYVSQQIAKANKSFPAFAPGSTVRVHVKIVEGATERVQAFEGVVLKIKRNGIGTTFTVKKISHGEGVERNFMLYSPRIEKIELIKRGKVRRAKLYYMRELKGKAARIEELTDYKKAK
jgi:large subunit ribosomal protein L19